MKTFSQALIERKNQGYIPVIPDIKCISPKDGDLLQGRDAVEIAQSLVRVGAPVLSVVTAEADFGGSMAGADLIELGIPFSDPMAEGERNCWRKYVKFQRCLSCVRTSCIRMRTFMLLKPPVPRQFC